METAATSSGVDGPPPKGPRMIGFSIPRSFNKTLLFIKLIFALTCAGVLAAQDTSASVSGEIRGPGGATVPSINAEFTLLEPPHTRFSLRLDDEGKFKFTVLPPGTYTLTVARLGFKTLKVKSILVESAEQKTLPPLRMEAEPSDTPFLPIPEFELHAADRRLGNLSGHVMRDESRAIAGAIVKLFCEDKLLGETKTDDKGEFVFFNLSPRDDYAIRVARAGYYLWQWTNYAVQAGYDATYGSIVLRRRVKLSRAATTVR